MEGTEKSSLDRRCSSKKHGSVWNAFLLTMLWPTTPVWALEPMVVVIFIQEVNTEYVLVFMDGSTDLITDNTGSAVAVPSHRVTICKQTTNFILHSGSVLYSLS